MGARPGWVRLLAVALIAAAAISYLRDLRPRRVPLPMRASVVDAPVTVDALPAAPGSLAGRNLLLVTLDTTRPDRLGCYGGPHPTPTLDRLAREGVIFSEALATGSTTLPTHASILTGLYPHQHGARANGLFRLPEARTTLAEMLSRAGYDTGAFVSAFVLASRFGLAQGFAHYDDDMGTASTLTGYAERRGDHTTDAAIRWLDRRKGPWFLWVHYYDPHAAYTAPGPFSGVGEHRYDGEIAFMDAQLSRLLAAAKAASQRDPLVVVTADHGEAFGDHDEWTHGYLLYETTLRIPLLVHAPDAIQGGAHVAERVSQVDLVPTIASLLGVPLPAGLHGLDLTRPPPASRSVLAESVEGQASFGWAGLAALYRGPLKYIHGPRPELYATRDDPLESSNLLSARRSEANDLRGALARLRGDDALVLPRDVDLDAGDVARLEALGYAVSAGQSLTPRDDGPTPQSMLPLLYDLLDLLERMQPDPDAGLGERILGFLQGREDRAGAIAALEAMTQAHPEFAPAYQYLATLYDAEDRSADASRARERLAVLFSGSD